MLEIIQYLDKNKNMLSLLKEGKLCLLNVSPLDQELIISSFFYKKNKTLKDSILAYWRA